MKGAEQEKSHISIQGWQFKLKGFKKIDLYFKQLVKFHTVSESREGGLSVMTGKLAGGQTNNLVSTIGYLYNKNVTKNINGYLFIQNTKPKIIKVDYFLHIRK